MRGLTDEEARALRPIGPPGEPVSDAVLEQLIADGRGRWEPEADGYTYFTPTAAGLLALFCYEAARTVAA